MKPKLSAVINTKNAASTLERTLSSVSFCDEVVVVDMASQDGTKKVAKKYTSKVYSHPDVGYVEPARNFAIKKASHDWVLIVDADEVISHQLSKKIEDLIKAKSDVSCYFLPRKNIIFGKWIEKTGWWPDFQPRLFQKGKVTWQDEVHSVPQITGHIEYLPADPEQALIHYNYESISEYILRLDRYTTIAASESPNQVFTAAGIIHAFKEEVFRRLFLEKGVEEGIHGVGLSFLQSMYQLVTYLKEWEVHGGKDQTESVNQTMAELESFYNDLTYWLADYHAAKAQGTKKLLWRARKKFRI